MIQAAKPLDHVPIKAEELFRVAPPVIQDRNKKVIHRMTCPPGTRHGGTIEYTRWGVMEPADEFEAFHAGPYAEVRQGFYDYQPLLPHAIAWHVNFADPYLFSGYGGPLFAQDEIMVAEHPVLGALLEYLEANGHEALTVSGGQPTPVLVAGAQRRCAIDIAPNVDGGRREGLYGGRFVAAAEEAVRSAVKLLDPPTQSNIIAMASLSGGVGPYTGDQICHLLRTAHTGFHAAVLESARLRDQGTPVVVHTGFWGCGAFGGNRELMTMVQVFAAHLAGVDHVVFHAGDGGGVETAERAIARLQELMTKADGGTSRLVTRIRKDGYRWNQSNGS